MNMPFRHLMNKYGLLQNSQQPTNLIKVLAPHNHQNMDTPAGEIRSEALKAILDQSIAITAQLTVESMLLAVPYRRDVGPELTCHPPDTDAYPEAARGHTTFLQGNKVRKLT